MPKPLILLDSLNLNQSLGKLCHLALAESGSITGAAELLGITPFEMKAKIVEYGIKWPPVEAPKE